MIRNTKNFNLKKPEQGDFYNVDDFNDNSDIIDAELENRKKAQEDDEKNIKGLTNPEYDDSGTVSGIDSFPAFLNKTKSKMNIFQWYRDFKAGMQFVLHAGQIVNNCVSSDADKPLAAAQGKALQDQLTKLYSDFQYKELTNEFDLNKALGKYRTDSSTIIASLKNKPSEIRNAGETTLDWYPANERNTYGIQIMRWTFGNTHMIFTRNKTENTWAKWVQCATKSDLDKGQFVVKAEENIQKVITSQSDIVRGTLPSQMKDCAYAAIGFSDTIDNELSIVVDGNSIIVSPKKTNNAVTINWFQFN